MSMSVFPCQGQNYYLKSKKERGFLKHLLNKRGDLSFLSYFPKQKLVRKIQGKFKKLFDNFVSEQLPLPPKNLHFFQALSLPIYFNSLQFSKSLVPARHACHTILIVLTLQHDLETEITIIVISKLAPNLWIQQFRGTRTKRPVFQEQRRQGHK